MHIKYDGPDARRATIIGADTGEQIRDVIEADDTEGRYLAHKRNDAGRLVTDGDSYVTERHERRIRIEFR